MAAQGSASYLRRGLTRYLNSALLSPALMARLEARPNLLGNAAALFESSDLAVDLLAYHPEEIEHLGTPEDIGEEPVLPFARSAAQRADELRRAYRHALLREVAKQLLGSCPGDEPAPFSFLRRFTSLAESTLRDALAIAVEETCGTGEEIQALEREPFAVLALGRMGSGEMSVGSDADLLFVVEGSLQPAEQARWRRCAERLMHMLGSHTREGVIFAVDTRLRPRGNEGELVPSMESVPAYLSTEAAAWEAVTFLKLRPVAGNFDLGARAVAAARTALAGRFSGPAHAAELARELGRIRAKLDRDAAGPRAKGRFKKMAGGYYDLEYVIGHLTLACGFAPSGGNTLAQIASLEAAKALDAAGIGTLRQTAILYRAADHAARLITGRPLPGWPEPALAGRIASLLQQWGVRWEGELPTAMQECGRNIRALYQAVLG
jgi:glutamate-ammonia-ligase adenylyltransferase